MQSSHTITLDWVEIWTAYLEAGLSKREFYRQCLPTLISSRKCPPLGERQKFCVHGIIGARLTGTPNEHEHQTQFS